MDQFLGSTSTEVAFEQWNALKVTLEQSGGLVETINPSEGLPDQVFLCDPGIAIGSKYFVSQFKNPERAPEAAAMEAVMTSKGYEIVHLPENHHWEGNGELIVGVDRDGKANGKLYGGHGMRSDRHSHEWIAQSLGFELQSFFLTMPEYYHLDTCFSALPGNYFLAYPPAISAEDWASFSSQVPAENIYLTTEEEAQAFALNVVVSGAQVILNQCSATLRKWLEERDLIVVETPATEFMKAGGSTKCMTHKVYRT